VTKQPFPVPRCCKKCSGHLELLVHIPRRADPPGYDVFGCIECDALGWLCADDCP
jgi:hypothetical protein